MKIFKYILCYILVNSLLLATFSIVAVDKTTGEVGSAGGSCIAGSIIISDIHPGIGAIHTQSYYLQANQNYASTLMDQGYSPAEIIQFLEENPFVLPLKGSVIKDALIDEDFLHVLTEDELIIFDINVYP